MFEVVLSTLESKLRKVENLDRAVQLLVRRVDGLEKKLEGHHAGVMGELEKQGKARSENDAVVNKKLDYLAKKFDSVCEEDVKEAEELLLASPSVRRSSRLLPTRFFFETRDQLAQQTSSSMEEVKNAVSMMDRRLAFHINIVSENMGKMVNMVEDVHDAVIEEAGDEEAPAGGNERKKAGVRRRPGSGGGPGGRRRGLRLLARAKKSHNGTTTATKKVSKFDKLLAAVYPLNVVMFDVDEKVERFKDELKETKGAVEFLLPRSEELLVQNRRQEDALGAVRTELEERTEAIMQEIALVSKLAVNVYS